MQPIPKIKDLYNDIFASLQTEFSGITIPLLGPLFLRALAAVFAAKLMLYYYQLGRVQKNVFPDQAEPESAGGTLQRYGRGYLNRDEFPAKQGQYTVTVTGDVGATLPAETVFQSNDTAANPGKNFVLDTAYTLSTNPDTITIRALEAGIESRLNIGETLTATSAIPDVESTVVVASVTVPPQAAEDIEDYRRKILEAIRLEPQGGAGADYRLWAFDAQGVRQSYPYAKSGASNEINLFVEATIADSTDGKGTPTSAILDDVVDVVEMDPDTTKPTDERKRRPLGVHMVHVLPITVLEIDITIADYADLDTAKETLIEDALAEEMNNIRPFVASCDVIADKNDILSTNKIIGVILNAIPGSVFGAITLSVGGTPVSSFTFDEGNIPHLNSVTHV